MQNSLDFMGKDKFLYPKTGTGLIHYREVSFWMSITMVMLI